MTIKATVVIQKESKADPRKPPGEKDYYAALHLFSEDGKEYGVPRYLSNFEGAGNLLQREAGVSHESYRAASRDTTRGKRYGLLSRWKMKSQSQSSALVLGQRRLADSPLKFSVERAMARACTAWTRW